MVGSFLVLCLFRMVEDGYQWVFSRVYGPIERSLRESFWEELGSISGLWEEPWCVGGDFMRFSLLMKDLERAGSPTP